MLGGMSVLGASLEWARAQAGIDSAPGGNAREIATATLAEFLVLAVLREHEMYGREIARTLSEHSDFGISPGLGILYSLLKKLAKEGALNVRRSQGSSRVFYSLTDLGRDRLLDIARRWAILNESVQSMVTDNWPLQDGASVR